MVEVSGPKDRVFALMGVAEKHKDHQQLERLLEALVRVTASGHVGYAIYTGGSTFLHEHMHFQKRVGHIYEGRTIDEQLLY
ncbi:MAG: hypothetical protein LQ350_000611 [Teloschistes chrysophthalmus]|nr:MAG: hypothetical protein LQ350_000611 [Niorma chrysophthalma]